MAVDDWPLCAGGMREYTHGRWGTEIVKKNAKLADDIVAAVADSDRPTAGQDRGASRVGAARQERPMVGPQRTPSGLPRRCSRPVYLRRHPSRLRPPL